MSGRAFLLIADISGYTRFVRHPSISASHARQIIGRLLKALVRITRPPFRVAELEGDAVFLYAPRSSSSPPSILKDQIADFFRAFEREIREIDGLRTCACDACAHVIDLKLKQVLHEGEVATEKIGRFRKLFGLDVVLVHRMLKTGVPSREYVLMTEQAFKELGPLPGSEPQRREEELEGLGKVSLFVFDAPAFKTDTGTGHSFLAKLWWRWDITFRTALHWLGIRRLSNDYRNLPQSRQ